MADSALEKLLAAYRAAPATAELELRYQGVTAGAFAAILDALAGGRVAGAAPPALEYTISTVTDGGARDRGALIRELRFAPGGRRAPPDAYRAKTPLSAPVVVRTPGALTYRVNLADETPVAPFPVANDAHLRVKARVSFRADDWRFDLTVVREVTGVGGAKSLAAIRDQMFWAPPAATPPAAVPAALLAALGVTAGDARAHVYRYEVEIEHVGDAGARAALSAVAVEAAAHVVLEAASPEYLASARYQAAVHETARVLISSPAYLRRFESELGLKSLLPQVRALTRSDYLEMFPPTGLYVGVKADGFRAAVLMQSGRCAVLSDRLYEVAAPAVRETTLLDCEFVPRAKLVGAAKPKTRAKPAAAKTRAKTPVGAAKTPAAAAKTPAAGGDLPDGVLYVFDAMVVAGERLVNLTLAQRLERVPAAVAALRACGLAAEPKPWARLAKETLEAQLRGALAGPHPFETDGLVFATDGAGYADTVSYKWKPPAHMTIDFLARRAPQSARKQGPPHADAPGHELHYLFVGANVQLAHALGLPDPPGAHELYPRRSADVAGRTAGYGNTPGAPRSGYAPVAFVPPDAPLAYLYQHPKTAPPVDGLVVELRRPADTDAAGAKIPGAYVAAGGRGAEPWELVQVRHDRSRELAGGRYFGNDYSTALFTWNNVVAPFPADQLWAPTSAYFRAAKDRKYRVQTKYTLAVKRRLAEPLAGAEWVVDLMAGRGGDLFNWLQLGFRHLVAVDADADALAELQRRRLQFARETRAGGIGRRAPTTLFTLRADLAAPARTTAGALADLGLPPEGAHGVLVNLGVHYLLASEAGLQNFAQLCAAITRPGGTVVLSFMRGDRVFARLKPLRPGESWDVRENDALKFSVRRLYADTRLAPAGQRVGVLMPFSQGEYYEEFLVNVAALTSAMKRARFDKTRDGGFEEYEADFALASELTDGDRAYLHLYGFAAYVRRADPKR